MIIYLDTSALVPLLVDEPSSNACGELWDNADRITSTRLAYVEAAAAVAQAERMDRISANERRDAMVLLEELWLSVDVIELGEALMTQAAALALTHGLRGYDAAHCAAAVMVQDDDLVAASGDARLLDAWQSLGVATRDVTA